MKNTYIGLVIILLSLSTTATAGSNVYKPDANAPRSAVPEKYKWDTSQFFTSDGQWESAYNSVKKRLDDLAVYKGKLNNLGTLKKCLDDYISLQLLFSKVGLYANLKSVEDENNEHYNNIRQRSISLANDFNTKTLFIRNEIVKLDDKTAGGIKEYKSYLEDIMRRKDRFLGDGAERVLAMAGDNLWSEVDINELPSDIEMIFKAVTRDIQLPKIKDEEGKEVQLNLSNYSKYRASKDRRVRSETVEGFFAALKKYQNVLAVTLGGEMKRDVFFAKVRGYKHAADAYLDRENIDSKVIANLINTIHQNLGPLHRYVELRKKILKLPDLHIYDLYTPLVPASDMDIPYNEGIKDIIEAMKPLGNDYVSVLSKAILPESKWVDIYPNKGKESGAFCTSTWGLHPYVKMNYQDKVDDVATLAHEFGHAMHSHLNMNAQPFVTFGYSTLVAEIASTTNEALLSKYLLKKYKDDAKMRLYLLGEQVENIRQTIYRQALFAEFEIKLHEYAEKGEPLTAELFNKTYRFLLKRYYGNGFTVGADDDVEWAYIPHFYWKFYVYSYATGLASGIAMAENMENGQAEGERYLAMLKASAMDKPLEVVKKAGIDLTKPLAVEAAARLMRDSINEMEKIYAGF